MLVVNIQHMLAMVHLIKMRHIRWHRVFVTIRNWNESSFSPELSNELKLNSKNEKKSKIIQIVTDHIFLVILFSLRVR